MGKIKRVLYENLPLVWLLLTIFAGIVVFRLQGEQPDRYQQWEYKIEFDMYHQLPVLDGKPTQALMEKLGSDGWELVSALEVSNSIVEVSTAVSTAVQRGRFNPTPGQQPTMFIYYFKRLKKEK